MKRQNHFIAQLISFLMSIVLLCGVLPVRVAAEAVKLTVSETVIYMVPGETKTIEYSLEGSESVPEVSLFDSEWYEGSLPEVTVEDGLITIALQDQGYGRAVYQLLVDGEPAGDVINVSAGEPAVSIQMRNSEGAAVPLKQGTYSLGYDMEPNSANFGKVELLSENHEIAIPVNGSRNEFELISTGQTRVGIRSGDLEQWIDLEVVDGDFATEIELKDGKGYYEMNIGDSIPSPFVINPDGSSYADDVITYESSDESVVSVDPDGTVHALQAGHVYIQVFNSFQTVSESAEINVKSDVTGIHFDAESYTVNSRKNLDLSEHLIIEPEEAKNHSFIWSSSDTAVVSAGNHGEIYFIDEGTATVRAEDPTNHEIYAECQVNAVRAEDISFKLLSPQPLLLERGDRHEILYELTGTDEEPVFDLFWTDASITIDGNVICVDENSRLAGFQINVFAEDTWVGEISGTVVAYPKSIALNIPKTYHLSEQEVNVFYRLDPYDAYISSEPLCSSSDPSVASFDNPDNPTVLTLKKAGKTVISIDSDNGLHDEKEITVIDYDYAVSAVWKDEQEMHYVLKGETLEVPLVLKPEGHQFEDDEITYRFSDETVITVDENGVLKGMNCGSARITAYGRMGRLGDVKVNVYEKPEHISFRKNDYMLTDGMSLIEGMDQIVFEPAGARYGEYRFTSSNEDAAVVGETGQISYRGNGTAVIRVESVSEPSVFAECTVNTTNESKPLEKVELPDVTGYVGADLLIRINVIPEEAVRYDLFNYHCEADNDNVRLYEDDYWKAGYYGRMIRFSCLKPGTTEIKVINTNEGGFTATCKVTIVDGKTDWKETYSIGRSDARRELDDVTEPEEYVFYLGEEYHLKREFKSEKHDGYFMMPTAYHETLKPLLEETGLFANITQEGVASDGRGESRAFFKAAKAGTAIIEPVTGKKVKVTVVDKAVLEPEVKGDPKIAEALKGDSTLGIDFDEELNGITIPEDVHVREDEKITVQTYLDINVKEAEDTKLVIDITPMYQIAVVKENASGSDSGTIVSEPKELEIRKPVTMEIPVKDLFPDGTQVYIQHQKEDGTVYAYTGTVENGTVKFMNPDGFSQFIISVENLSKVLIGNVVYETLQDAVNNVKDGETITVNTDESLEAEVSKVITFNIENNAHVTIKAGKGYRVEQNGTVYTVTARTPLVKTEAKAPTCTEDGNKEYWTDPDTGRYYADEEGTEEIAKDSWILKATGHKYGTPTYTWNGDKVTAKAVCEHDSTHVITETVTATSKVTTEPTCEKDGVRTYTAVFKNSMFRTQIKTESIPAIGHKYGTPVYTWSSDNKTVTATVTCTNDRSHKITETVNTTYKVTKEATETAEGTGTYTASFKNTIFKTQTKNVTIPKKTPAVKYVEMHRLYNPYSGEHFYTGSTEEKDFLEKAGWRYEGIGWTAPEKSSTPVYRLYNKNAGDHHYTTDAHEREVLISVGWIDEKIGWYSDDSKGVPLYRQYNPNAKAGSHNYTTDKHENDTLVSFGWIAEGIGWYGMKN